MTQIARLVWLFDVDGTLLSTDGLARGVFAGAIGRRLGVEDDLAGIAFAGRTDPVILGDILARHARALPADEIADFFREVSAAVAERLPGSSARLLEGVPELLDRVEREPGWIPALLTGNTSLMARAKLAHFGIHHRFRFGAFGEEAENRDALARVAVARARDAFGVSPERCVVVGDTELDVACARAAGARAVAVATGSVGRARLAAAAPDLLLDDLRDAAPLIEWARRLP